MDENFYINTNIGKIPYDDYLDIVAIQNGFEDYADMKNQGLCIDRGDIFEKTNFDMFK